jgi:hypothetical protein
MQVFVFPPQRNYFKGWMPSADIENTHIFLLPPGTQVLLRDIYGDKQAESH